MESYKPKRRLKASDYAKGVLEDDRVILSQAITIVESNLDEDKRIAKELVNKILTHSGNSIRIAITGVPGVGKSTFIESLGKLIISKGHKVAVLSIDPSSKKSKGSILGDKTRMEELVKLDKAYIRPSAAGGTIGGVANKTYETILLCEAAGYDVILVETVGVGQSEIKVSNMTDFFLLLMLAGAGDELQGIKKGIMEMADMLVINKADGDNVQLSEVAKQQYQNTLHIFPQSESGWTPVVSTASALKNIGIEEVWSKIEDYFKLVRSNGFFDVNRNKQKIEWMYSSIEEELKRMLYSSNELKLLLNENEKKILSSELSPREAAQKVINKFRELL